MTDRTSAKALVQSLNASSYPRVRWEDKLSARDRLYVDEIVSEMRRQNVIKPYSVADAIIGMLKIQACRSTVASTLKRMVRNGS